MKTYTITKIHNGREYSQTGTVAELTEYYGYTLECGNSWNHRIPLQPKTAVSLVSALNRSVKETQGSSYDPDVYYMGE
jgi:hypothetical protein